ncbi:cytochrome oxidase biogenesis protein Sco1/SenC/PrrC [alpha proteobacterium U9-1i]|nr:cytochrome oxidase biogenesis protein Sco1/SenC/PrrC [alpha proteobacterium U9-1i]
MTPSPTPSESPRRHLTGAVVPAIAAAALAGLGAMYLVSRQPTDIATPAGCILEHADALGGPIDLVDTHGTRMTQADFAGQPALVYFGFTHCPDICPTTMYTLNDALELPEGYDVQPILISVDPARDTPAVMGAYVETEGFPEGLIGLTGSEAQVAAAARAFQASASRGAASADGGYSVNHTSFLYVLDGNWRTVAAMPTHKPVDAGAGGPALVPVEPAELQACIVAGLDRRAEPAAQP